MCVRIAQTILFTQTHRTIITNTYVYVLPNAITDVHKYFEQYSIYISIYNVYLINNTLTKQLTEK